jgi:murein DD-endopeptidase MepM/ murein hydrolase activator NlpD
VLGYITDGFGTRRNPFGGGGYENHAGLDIATNHGTAIEATADGIVIFAGMHGGYGNVVVVDHGYGVTTRYGHMSKIDVQVGQHVTRGKVVGAVGSTGRSTAPHCHYEVRLHDRPVNPLNYKSEKAATQDCLFALLSKLPPVIIAAYALSGCSDPSRPSNRRPARG